VLLCYLTRWNHENFLTQDSNAIITALPEFNQSLPDFFNTDYSQLTHIRHGGGLGSPTGWVGSMILSAEWVELGLVELSQTEFA